MKQTSTDDHKTKDQLLREVAELRLEVDRLRFLETRPFRAERTPHPTYDELERRVTENMGWL